MNQEEYIKLLESENQSLKISLGKAEKRNQMFNEYLDDERPFLLEYEKLMDFLSSFIKWSQESNKLYTKKVKAILKKQDLKEIKKILKTIGKSKLAKSDKAINTKLYQSISTGNDVTRIRNIMTHLQTALKFNQSFRQKPQRKRKPTANELSFWSALEKHKIKPLGLDYVLDELEKLGYNSFKRTTVHSYLQKKSLIKKKNSA